MTYQPTGQDSDIVANSCTLTSHSSILVMSSVTVDSRATGAVSEVALTATAVNISQVDWANTSTKVSIAECHCSCWNKTYVNCGESPDSQMAMWMPSDFSEYTNYWSSS